MDYYQILDIDYNANPEEIKNSYKKLAFKYHPDKNKSHDATDKFKEINNAYHILSDPERKHEYDMHLKFGNSFSYQMVDPFVLFAQYYNIINSLIQVIEDPIVYVIDIVNCENGVCPIKKKKQVKYLMNNEEMNNHFKESFIKKK